MDDSVESLKGKTLSKIVNNGDNELLFYCDSGEVYKMYHNQDCCEEVTIDDIDNDLDVLLNSPILLAEEVSNRGEVEYGTCTWTFYKFATVNGYVTIKWYGTSNGYYSENVDFVLIKTPHTLSTY